jgi:hypothetical protein
VTADIAPRDLREVADRALRVLAGGDAPEHRHRAELLDRLHVTCSALTACVRAPVLANVADAPHPDEIAAALDHVYRLGRLGPALLLEPERLGEVTP